MRMLVLGAGLQGSACAFDLLQSTDAEVTMADARSDPLRPFLKSRKDKRLKTVTLDVRDHDAVAALMADHSAVMSALPFYLNLDMARIAIRVGVHFADLGGNTEITRRQRDLSSDAEEQRVSVIPDCGLAPGMVNILAAECIRRLEAVDEVRLYVGGLPQSPAPPLGYHLAFSLEGLLDYYTSPSWILRDGEPREIEALTEIEQVEFPEPLGTLEAFHTAGGLSTMPWSYDGIATMEYKTLRYPGHAQIMRGVRDLGLLDREPIVLDAGTVRPRNVFVAVVEPRLKDTDSHDVVALQVIANGSVGGDVRRVGFRLVDYYDDATGISAMMRATGFSLSITGQMQAGGRVERYGVTPAYEGMPFEPYVNALRKRGLKIEELD